MVNLERAKKVLGVEACKNHSNEELTELIDYFYLLARIKVKHTKNSIYEESGNHESGKQRRTS